MLRVSDVLPEQLDDIERIERQCFSLPWTRRQLEVQLDRSHHVFLAASDGQGRMLGYVGLMYVLDEGYISNVAVSPEHRCRGIGDALISALKRRAEELELSFITLEVRRSNAPAIALYKKHGFTEVGARKGYYERPREDAVLMTYYSKGSNNENSCV